MAQHGQEGRYNWGIGCLMLPMGAGAGAMLGVLVSKLVQWATRGPQCSGIPTCDWHVYAGWGALAGALSLPALVLWSLLRRPASEADSTTDTNRS
ncbi:hypothetical protein [Roseisolibacter sp. H3M3-2]|uniref:hypothetical protein n=1 Tax=Roseisolibacter sp. H3M3-2 TaxID=3031323 RepID=UPI0023D9E7CA|nr:hypothetical protein [Roseisolibacter sp. H3M3-2]MDF1502983.1 hypothetical protein [Roseisolibacter sp. H3M3-2]